MKCAVRRVVKVIRRCTRECTIEKNILIAMVRVCVHLNSYINLDKGIWVSKVEEEERK